MKNNIISKSILMLLMVSLLACNKQLNVLPTTSEVDGSVVTDLQSARTALNGVYYRFANAGADYNSVPVVQWYSVQEGLPSELSGLVTYPYGGSGFTDHTFNATSYGVGTIWVYGYNLLNAANGFLKNLASAKTISAGDKNEMTAEALFFRAFAHATLLLYYGQYYDSTSQYGIIIRNDFVTASTVSLARSGVGEAYGAILSDLDNAIAGLPEESTQKYYTNVWAAKLLKARLLINRGTAADYTDVISLTKDIINNGPFTLEDSTKDIFLEKGISSNEVMLGLQPYDKGTPKYTDYLYYNTYVGTDSLAARFENDPRAGWMFQTIENPYYGGNEYLFKKYYPGDASNPSPNSVTEFSYAFRLTEAYLLEAEALTASGGDMAEAKSLLKTVLGHAGFTDFAKVDSESTGAGLLQQIIEEEMKNFVSESGQDWFAIRRLTLSTLQTLLPVIHSKDQLLLPIPQTEITANGKLAGHQNPGY